MGLGFWNLVEEESLANIISAFLAQFLVKKQDDQLYQNAFSLEKDKE
jgi:hypothetical protein